jgi:spore protease
MSSFQVRTDLALEARESISQTKSELHGVHVEEYEKEAEDIHVTRVIIETKNAAKAMGKPIGTYITIEAPQMLEPDEDYHREISECLSEELLNMLPEHKEGLSVLIVGLGNREVTADALGPRVLDNLMITRHIMRTYGKAAYGNECVNEISSIEPGVMAKTGMETAEIVKGVVDRVSPAAVIAVDALASLSTNRLCRSFQISDTGIVPGSGAYNSRRALDEKTLGVPVIALGVPTVVDADTIVSDALKDSNNTVSAKFPDFLVTPKDIDALIEKCAKVLGYGINIALQGDMSVADMEQFLC